MRLLLLLALVTLAGCRSVPAPTPLPSAAADTRERERRGTETERERGREVERRQDGAQVAARPRRARPEEGAAAGQFDFYLLNLSWSPEFCATHAESAECGRHLGFVLHGLWPQNLNGTYPEHCGDAPGPAGLGVLQGIVPTQGLMEHEWAAHGVCTGLSPEAWEEAQRRAFTAVRVPAGFGGSDGMLAPGAIVGEFMSANPGLPAGSVAVSCGGNRLTAVEVCLGKDLRAVACQGVRSCGAMVVKITGR